MAVSNIQLHQGDMVDYFSTQWNTWVEARITVVEPETGAVEVDVRPGFTIDRPVQICKLRPRTRPSVQRLEWLGRLLNEGFHNTLAQELFEHIRDPAGRSPAQLGLLQEASFRSMGAEVDRRFGTAGSVVRLARISEELVQSGAPRGLSLPDFSHWLWLLAFDLLSANGHVVHRHVTPAIHQDPWKVYKKRCVLGEGSYGSVCEAEHKSTGVSRAVKSQQIKGNWEDKLLDAELETLRSLDHPNIVKMYEHYRHGGQMHLVMDLATGGDLQNHIHAHARAYRGEPFRVGFVKDIFRQALSAIAHIHSRGILHLDLKPANVTLTDLNDRTMGPGRCGNGLSSAALHVMIIDVGVAKLFQPGNFRGSHPVGTPNQMAPEIWTTGELTPQADVWSLGCIFFELLSLKPAFHVRAQTASQGARFWQTRPMPNFSLCGSSAPGVELCRSMLTFERLARPNVKDCLGHAFFHGDVQARSSHERVEVQQKKVVKIPTRYAKRMLRTHERSLLQKSMALKLAQAWPASQLPTLNKIFKELDVHGEGFVSRAQLQASLSQQGYDQKTVERAVCSMDFDLDDRVAWSEFVAASISLGELRKDVRRLFDSADHDGDGLLSQEDLARLMQGSRLQRSSTQVKEVFRSLVGRDESNARLDWPTFRRHFQSGDLGEASDSDEEAKQARLRAAQGSQGLLGFVGGVMDVLRPSRCAVEFIDTAKLKELQAMGFDEEDAREALLQAHNNLDAAAARLVEGNNIFQW